MPLNQPVRRIAIVGTGVIGASRAAYYLSRGFDMVATVVDAVLKEAQGVQWMNWPATRTQFLSRC